MGFGLRKLPRDTLDFSHSKVFGAIALEEVPDNFEVAELLGIKNQDIKVPTDLCAAAAACAVSEDQEGISLSMEYFFGKIKEAEGRWNTWGADLRTTCKVACKVGFLEEKESPFTLEEKGRDFVANWSNWHLEYDLRAKKHRKQSFFKVDGQNQPFDSIRSIMWQNRAEKRSVLTGVMWCPEWTNTPDGIIKEQGTPMFGHALKIFGSKKINGELYLMAQLSNGTGIGDNGIFYFSRKVINECFKYGAYTFRDMPAKEAKKKSWTYAQRLRYLLRKYIGEIMK